jgi:hypothetical protein
MPEPRSLRSEILGALIAGLIVVGFCLVLLWHDRLLFWNDDYELSILPVFADISRSWSEGHLPLLSPYSWVCSNLAGEFQYGTFSIFVNAAVVLIWKFPLTFPQQAAALSITHLFVLAFGSFLLARDRKLSISLSIFVALIAALNGWIICWGATDWFGALGAFAWLPWAWWGLERALDPQRTRWRWIWPAPFVYLLVTGGFPYTVLMLVLLIGWLACRAVVPRQRDAGGAIKSFSQTRDWKSVGPMIFGAALGFGLSAPAWLAIFDYVQGSARSLHSAGAHLQWIVPWRALPALVLPCWTVSWADFSTRYLPHTATELACGLAAPAAVVAGFLWRPRLILRRIKWELVLLVVLLVLSMVPTAGLFRWSFRWLPFFHLVLALCAAEVLRLRTRLAVGSTAFLLLLIITIPMAIFNLGGTYAAKVTWIYFQIAAIWALFELFLPITKLRRWMPPIVTFAILLATYICIPPNCGVPKYNFSQDLIKPEPLDRNRLYLAVYSPAEYAYRREYRNGPVGELARPGSTPMWAQLHFINGYSPILTAGVAREFTFFIHGEIDRDVGKYLVENQSGPGGILDQLGVDGIVVAPEIAVEPTSALWRLELSSDDGRVFHRNDGPLARVRSVEWIDTLPEKGFATAKISDIDDSRNHIGVNLDVPAGGENALLTFSRPYFRGYHAAIGNRALRVDSYRGLFPIVEVPAGTNGRLTLIYRPWWLIAGVATSIFCVAIWIFGMFGAMRSRQLQIV